jgi:hypothetical protein
MSAYPLLVVLGVGVAGVLLTGLAMFIVARIMT